MESNLNVKQRAIDMSITERPNPEKIKVTIGIPGYGHVPSLCLLSMGSFIAHGVANGYVHHIGSSVGAYIDRARNEIVRQALGNGSTHLMFLDQDMVIPEMALTRLLSHKKPVVGGIYFGKDDLFTPVVFKVDPFSRPHDVKEYEIAPVSRTSWMPDSGDQEPLKCICGKPDDHLHKVGGTGMGCTLISVSLLRKMKKEFGDETWFSSKECGEDVHFANRCHEMGIPFFMDGVVQCGHIRDQLVSPQHYTWAREQITKKSQSK